MYSYADLEGLLKPGKIRLNESMARHTTFRVGGRADALCLPETRYDLVEVTGWASLRGIPWLLIGNGSNVIFDDEGVRGIVIKIRGSNPANDTLWHLNKDHDLIHAGAGVSLARLAWFSAACGMSGLEFGSGIPGVVGGSIRGNAGAHGCELSQTIESIELLIPPNTITTISAVDAHFSYRHMDIDPNAIITGAVFRLIPEEPELIRDRITSFTEYRKQTQPSADQSAGCMFKNPSGDSAGRLIDVAGCKGWHVGGVKVSEQHANFLVNSGEANTADTLRLIDKVRDRVLIEMGIELELEVRILSPEVA